MENCFEKHRVNLDPSSGRSETSTVYRPIDKYMNVLPHLIGSEKWKEKWHVGLLDTDKASHASEQYAESVDSNPTRSSSLQPDLDATMVPESSFLVSQDLASSTSSLGGHMAINQSSGLFDSAEHAPLFTTSIEEASTSSFFRLQTEQRKIVNLFDDEPPSLEPSPVASRKTENLFYDDYGSAESLPAPSLENIVKNQPPVDLFNDNEFDDFIKKIEQQPAVNQPIVDSGKFGSVTSEVQKVQDMKKISEEIKKVQLKKVQKDKPAQVESKPEVKKEEPVQQQRQSKQSELVKPIEKVKSVVPPEPEIKTVKPRLKNITNLFDDDDDDQDDYFSQIIKQKATSKPLSTKTVPVKSKPTNLFDNEIDSEDMFAKGKVEVVEPLVVKKTVSLLFDDDDDDGDKPQETKHEPVKQKSTNLFDDDNDSDIFMNREIPRTNIETLDFPKLVEKSKIPEAPLFIDPEIKVFEKEENLHQNIQVSKDLQEQIENKEKVNIDNFKQDVEKKETVEQTIDDSHTNHEEIPYSEDCPAASHNETSIYHSTPSKSFNATLPFLSDEPPEDDSWEPEDHFDEQPELASNTNVLNYSSIQLFDDVPPDDDFIPNTKLSVTEEDKHENVCEIVSNATAEDDVENDKLPGVKENSQIIADILIEAKEAITVENESTAKAATDQVTSKQSTKTLPVTGSVKNKLNKFTKRAEEIPADFPKKPLPGKLNMNLKINVGALMPGARLPSRDAVDHSINISNNSQDAVSSQPFVSENSKDSNLLNNDATRSRAKIQVKRRPSTRRGRQANYQKALSIHQSEEEPEEENESTPKSIETLEPPLTKNLAASVFDEMSDDEKLLNSSNDAIKTNPLIFDEVPPPVEPILRATTSKMSVFYDDEDDTRLVVEQQRKQEQAKMENSRQNLSVGLFDNLEEDTLANIPERSTTKVVEEKKSKETKTAFYDESDDDLFGGNSSLKSSPPKIVAPSKLLEPVANKQQLSKPTTSLFDDDEEDNLFASNTKSTSIAVKKSRKLFESDDDESETNGSIIFPAQPKKQSLFGDESDDDDLFSSKPKCKFKIEEFSRLPNFHLINCSISNQSKDFIYKVLYSYQKTVNAGSCK